LKGTSQESVNYSSFLTGSANVFASIITIPSETYRGPRPNNYFYLTDSKNAFSYVIVSTNFINISFPADVLVIFILVGKTEQSG